MMALAGVELIMLVSEPDALFEPKNVPFPLSGPTATTTIL